MIKSIQEQAYETQGRYKKPVTASIIQVEFDADEAISRNQNRYDSLLTKLNSGEIKNGDLSKYNNWTSTKTYENFLNFSKSRLNHSSGLNSLSRSQSSKQSDDWNKCFDKYYLNVKRIHPEKKNCLI